MTKELTLIRGFLCIMSEQEQLPGGSFGAATGGTEALRDAMQRRGIDASILDQLTPGAVAGAAPIPQSPSDLSVAQSALPQPEVAPTAGTPTPPPTDPELMVAIEALAGFTKSAGNTRRDLAKARVGGLI